MKLLDILLFSSYLVIVMIIGVWHSSKNQSFTGRYTADRGMHWGTVGISVMVTAFSSINFLAMPSEVYANGLYVLIAIPFFFITGFPVTKCLIPFFHQLKLVSVYSYLGVRFSDRVRLFTAIMFIIWRFAWMAVALFAAGKMLHVIIGMSLPVVILLSGLCATVYTALGGIRSVMQTDIVQFVVLTGAIVAGVILAASANPEGISGIYKDAYTSGLLKPFAPFDPDFFSFNPFIRITFWSGAAGIFVAFTARYGVDQVVVQRYFTTPSASDSIRGFWFNSILAAFALLLLAFLGLSIKSYAMQTGSLAKGWPALKQMAHFFSSMPTGVYGLVTAGIAAATMSSIDSGVNSCSAVWYTDIKKSHVQDKRKGFLYSLVIGCFVTSMALVYIPLLGNFTSLFSMMNKIINGLGAPLLALFIAGLFFSKATEKGALYGGIAGLIYSLTSVIIIKNMALHYYAVMNFGITLLTILIISKLDPSPALSGTFQNWGYRSVMNTRPASQTTDR